MMSAAFHSSSPQAGWLRAAINVEFDFANGLLVRLGTWVLHERALLPRA